MIYLAVNVNVPFESTGEALSYGLPLALFGFAVVFAILAILWGILSLFKVFFYVIPEKKKHAAKQTEVPSAAPAAPETVAAPAAPAASAAADDSELVAVISAAIAAYRSLAGESVGGFRVVSLKKRK